MENNIKKPNVKLLAISVVIVLIIVVAAVIVLSKKSPTNVAPVVNNEPVTNVEVATTTETEATATTPVVAIPDGARIDVVGASPIAKDNTVLAPNGQAAVNSAVPMSDNAPKQTQPILVNELPASAVKLVVNASGFAPKDFSVAPGVPVTLSLTSADTMTHVFMFDDNTLAAVALGVGPKETRAITFNAPKAGEYTFRCDVPGHSSRGETGKMIVK